MGAFDNDFYSGEKSKFEGYHTSLAIHDDEPDDDETPLIGNQKRASYTAPKAVLNENRRMAEESEEDPFKEHARPTIADREDEYRARRRAMVISPQRADPFADGGRTPAADSRGFAQIMKETQLKGVEKDLEKQMRDRAKEGTLKVVDTNIGGAAPRSAPKRRGRWDVQTAADETPTPKAKKAAPEEGATTPARATLNQWDATPGRKDPGAETPGPGAQIRQWDPTPAHATPGRDTPAGGMTPGAQTPGTARRNRWDETPRTDRETPAHTGWAETPRTDRGAGGAEKIISETPTPSASKRKSRWDETPVAGTPTPTAGAMTPSGMTPAGLTPGGMTPVGATPGGMTPGGATPSMMTPGMTPSMTTPMGQKAMAMQTPSASQMAQMTPEQLQAYRWEREIDERNRVLSDEELDQMFPPGYKVLPPPAGYVPIRTPSRKLTATPTPMVGQTPTGFYMQPDTPGGDRSGKFMDNQPKEANLPFLKPEDAQYFDKLLVDVDEDQLSPEELKERTIMKLLLKIKNGTPPMRKSALRRVTDQARTFGAGPLFNQILPLLMSPTLEDQERHLLVKVIDRVLYKLDDLVRPYVHKILVVIEPLLIDEDYYARVEGREIISNLAKAAGLATMISTMRPDIDNIDEYVRNTTARAFAVVASALGIPSLLPFLKAVCRSKKSWQV